MGKVKILFSFGTRPELIKLAPLIKIFKKENYFLTKVCNTGQHFELVNSLLDYFKIFPDFDLEIMKSSKSLNQTSSLIIEKAEKVLLQYSPEYVFVHGDTTSSFAVGLAAFHLNIKVIHVEAGLRSKNLSAPFPEELNRVLTSKIAFMHYCPTEIAKKNLLNENIDPDKIILTGNTVVDSVVQTSKDRTISLPKKLQRRIEGKKIILFTGHRRENFGEPFEQIFKALDQITNEIGNTIVVFPVHPNPKVKKNAKRFFRSSDSILITDPLDYPEFTQLMMRSSLIISDSGGIQEEAPSFGIPVLVTREVTERMEGILAGTSILVGSDKRKIVSNALKILRGQNQKNIQPSKINPYGDGKSSEKILDHFKLLHGFK